MSCITGVGGDVAALVKVAKSGRDIVVLDGCPLECAKSCLRRQGVAPTVHLQLAKFGVKKVQHGSFDPVQAETVFETVLQKIKDLKNRQAVG